MGLPLLAGTVTVPLPAAVAEAGARVVVLAQEGVQPNGVPAGVTPGWVATALRAQGVQVAVVDADDVPADARVLVNPYGQAFPDTPAVGGALDRGAAWVNLAGVPFLAPNGTADAREPAAHGVFAVNADTRVVTDQVPTELGSALLPSLTVEHGQVGGPTIHAARPADERPLASYRDQDGVDAGPSVTLLLAPHRLVAVAPVGDRNPVNPDRPTSERLLAELVRLAAATSRQIQDVSVHNDGAQLVVAARATDGELTGTGTFPAPEPWSPKHPTMQWATVRLYDRGRLVDLRQLAANPAQIRVDGTQILVNGEPFIVKGMGPSMTADSMPPDMPPAEQGEVMRRDLAAMAEMGVNALRYWGTVSDWVMNRAAREGLFVMDALSFGWELQATDERVAELLPWAGFIGARAAERHNVLLLSVGNELADPDAGNAVPKLEQLTNAVRAANGGRQPITYGAMEQEPIYYGPLPFLDIYSYNNYGLTWPASVDSAGFAATTLAAKQFMAQGRPFLVTEFGGSSTPTAQLELATGLDLDAIQTLNAEVIYEKWLSLMAAGTVGGFAFIWADGRNHDFVIPYWLEITGAVEYPPGSGYHPLNTEEYFGFHDVYRNPRPAFWALRYAYSGKGEPPLGTGIPPWPGGS